MFWAIDALHPVPYVALLAASSLLLAWGGAGKFTVLADLLPSEHRLPANALVNTLRHASIIIGPATAGLLARKISPAWILGIAPLCEAALAVQVHRARKSLQPTTEVAPVDTRKSSGLRLLHSQPELLGLLALTWLFNFAYGPINVALPLYVRDDLHAQADLLGLHMTLLGVGALVGTLTAGLVLRKVPPWPTTLVTIARFGAALLPFSFTPPVLVTLGCFAVGGLIWGPFGSISLTLFQDRTPPHPSPPAVHNPGRPPRDTDHRSTTRRRGRRAPGHRPRTPTRLRRVLRIVPLLQPAGRRELVRRPPDSDHGRPRPPRVAEGPLGQSPA